ncbi:hypothetical protein HHI36_001167 [Cryptolaemus montrouzieri]|uniref:Uncharacterized protein n=1 Tax=Cryptolaemus montrouzieri TaxID=559131 RepID=A0ABD2P867_9CUCU
MAMCFYFWRPKKSRRSVKNNKSRRPYSNLPEEETSMSALSSDPKSETNMCNKFKNNRKQRPLLIIVQNLIDKNVSRTPPRIDTVVSPRKRFLRDMEKDKVTLEENSQKRIRNKMTDIKASTSTGTVGGASPLRMNGYSEDKPVMSASSTVSRNCSYSITSLLSDDRTPSKRSPNNSPSHFVSITTQKNFISPSIKSEELWYSESVERFRSIELSAEKGSFHSYNHPSFLPPFVYPYSYPSCYSYNSGFATVPPPIYHHPPTHHLPMPLIRHEAPSCSWKGERIEEVQCRKENSSSTGN